MWRKHGKEFAGLDATHNTTQYDNMSLFTLIARDDWGRGMPCAWMISSNAITETITYFLRCIKHENPDIEPEIFMSDKDRGQINAIMQVYCLSVVWLCWWHVLHAWQQYISIQHHVELWDMLKRWVRITDKAKFWTAWEDIKQIAPKSVVDYLQDNWLCDFYVQMWPAFYRTKRTIYQKCDTNMLVEAWHHLLKGRFLQGKKNRRLDHLIYTLCDVALPYFRARHMRQRTGFEGPSIEVKRRQETLERAKTIPKTSITPMDDGCFEVDSQSTPGHRYIIDLDTYDCSCIDFNAICFCKHIAAVQIHYPDDTTAPMPNSVFTDSLDAAEGEANMSTNSTQDNAQSEAIASAIAVPPTEALLAVRNLISKLGLLSLRLESSSVDDLPPLDAVQAFDGKITGLLQLFSSDVDMLPRKKRLAPNERNKWADTASLMGSVVKTGHKRKRDGNTAIDPSYGGGERSGKKAHVDAREPLPPPQLPTNLPSPSSLPPLPDGTTLSCPEVAPAEPDSLSTPLAIVPLPSDSVRVAKIASATVAPSYISAHMPLHTPSVNIRSSNSWRSFKQTELRKLVKEHLITIPPNAKNITIIACIDAHIVLSPCPPCCII